MNIATAAPGDDDDLPPDELIDVRQLAKMLRISVRTLWRLVRNQKAPSPIKLSGCTRWQKSVVVKWIRAGCPPQREGESKLGA